MTKQKVRDNLEYIEGNLYWKKKINPRCNMGQPAGGISKTDGYRYISLEGKRYPEHRLIWIYHNGKLNKKLQIDHMNHKRLDNRIENLRPCTRSQNHMNKPKIKNTTSHYKGVYFWNSKNYWVARVKLNGKYIYNSYHKDEKEAALAYNKAAQELFGKFAYLNEVD